MSDQRSATSIIRTELLRNISIEIKKKTSEHLVLVIIESIAMSLSKNKHSCFILVMNLMV